MQTIKLSTFIGQSEANIIKAINQDIIQPFQDCTDSLYDINGRESINAGVEHDFQNNAVTRNKKNFPSHITKLWDTSAHKAVFSEVPDTPMYTCRVQLTFDPSTATAGTMEFKMYVCETVPQLAQTIRVAFKATTSRMEAIFAFYIGNDTGWDVKANGVKFTYTSDKNGAIYDRGILIYKT